MNLTEELIQLALAAPEARKAAAVRVLRGENVTAQQSVAPVGPEPYLTLKDCAKRLGFAACTLWMWDVPSHSLGGRPRFRVSEVEAYLKSDAFKRRVADLKEKRRAKYRKSLESPCVGQRKVPLASKTTNTKPRCGKGA